MLRCLETVSGDHLHEHRVIDRVTLDLEARRKRRHTLTCVGGTRLLVDLPMVPSLRHGDGFLLEDGLVIEVEAAAEALLEVTPSVSDPCELARIAWHLGNRHLPVQFIGSALRIRSDHVIEGMLRKLGADVRCVDAPFDPEGGAYGHGHGHTHAHD